MNFIDGLNNKFLKQLFPEGIQCPVLLGQLGLDLADRITINIHVPQKPFVEIEKWGKWGKDYNIIVIKLICQFLNKVEIINWQNIDFCFLDFNQNSEHTRFVFSGDTWSVTIEAKALTFQNCDVYIK